MHDIGLLEEAGESRSDPENPTQTQGEHANCMQKGPMTGIRTHILLAVRLQSNSVTQKKTTGWRHVLIPGQKQHESSDETCLLPDGAN